MATIAHVMIQPLNESSFYMEHLGQAKLYHQRFRLIGTIDTSYLSKQYETIWQMNNEASDVCQQKCNELHEINLMRTRLKRAYNNIQIIQHVSSRTRRRRGLINMVGTLSKTLFGTLSNDDLDYINNEIDKLYKHTNTISQGLSNQTKIIKLLLNNANHDMETMGKINNEYLRDIKINHQEINKNKIDVRIANQLTITGFLLADLQEDTTTILNAIGDASHGIIHPQLFSPDNLYTGIKSYEKDANTIFWPDNTPTNYHRIIEMSTINILLRNNKLTYILDIPILEQDLLDIKHVIPIPRPQGNAYVALIPESPLLLINQPHTSYLPMTETLLDKCRKTDKIHVCERNQPSFLLNEIDSCDSQIINRKIKTMTHPKCQTALFTITELTYIQLTQQQGYLLFPKGIQHIDGICGNHPEQITITKPSRIYSTNECTLMTNGAILKMNPTTNTTYNLILNKNITIPFNTSDINLILDKLTPIQHHLDVNELKQLNHNLDEIQNQIDLTKNERRTHTWTETGYSTLKYLGYGTIILTIIWILNKIGIFKLISRNLKPCCIKIACNEWTNHYHQSEPRVEYRPTIERTDELPPYVPPKLQPLIRTPRSYRIKKSTEFRG